MVNYPSQLEQSTEGFRTINCSEQENVQIRVQLRSSSSHYPRLQPSPPIQFNQLTRTSVNMLRRVVSKDKSYYVWIHCAHTFNPCTGYIYTIDLPTNDPGSKSGLLVIHLKAKFELDFPVGHHRRPQLNLLVFYIQKPVIHCSPEC